MPAEEGRPDGSDLVELLGPFWSSARTAAFLGLEEAALWALQVEGSVLAVPSLEGLPLFPVFQFEPGAARVRPGVAVVLSVLASCDRWAVGLLLVMSAPEFGGRTPLEVARSGGLEEELEMFARGVRAEWR